LKKLKVAEEYWTREREEEEEGQILEKEKEQELQGEEEEEHQKFLSSVGVCATLVEWRPISGSIQENPGKFRKLPG
jgi:hypothetical protein